MCCFIKKTLKVKSHVKFTTQKIIGKYSDRNNTDTCPVVLTDNFSLHSVYIKCIDIVIVCVRGENQTDQTGTRSIRK